MKSAEPVIEIDLEIVRLLEDKQTAAAAAAGETLSNRWNGFLLLHPLIVRSIATGTAAAAEPYRVKHF